MTGPLHITRVDDGGGPPSSQNADMDSRSIVGVLQKSPHSGHLPLDQNAKGKPKLSSPTLAAEEMKPV